MAGASLDRFCPSCRSILRSWRIGPVKVDGCDTCGGVWFDAEELKAVTTLPGDALEALEGEFKPGLGGAGGGRQRCPADGTPLRAQPLKQAPEVVLEVCPTCRGLWLDDGELATLAARLPKSPGTPRAPAAPEAALTALAGLTGVVHCPACDAKNPELEPRCCACGVDLHRPPAGGVGNLLSSHPVQPLLILADLLLVVVLLAVLYYPSRRAGPVVELLPPGLRWLPAAVLLGWWGGRWLLKCWRLDATTGGLVLHRLLGRKFVPWETVRGAVVSDLGRRAPWAPLGHAVPFRPHPLGGPGHPLNSDEYREWHGPQPLKALMIVYTTRGLVLIGPDLHAHGELINRVRAHLG